MRTGAPLRVGVAGAGWVSSHHLAGWRRRPDVDLVAICDPDRGRAAAQAERFGIPAVYDDAAAMLAGANLDALDIAAPVGVHGPLCLLAAEHGVDVLCQKPLCATLAEAERVVSATTAHVRLMVHENWRFRPHYRAIKAWVEDGALGDLVACRMVVRASGLLPDPSGRVEQIERQPFFATLPRLLIGEVFVHHLDVLRWMMGDVRVVAAHSSRISPAVVGEDTGIVLLAGAGCWATLDGCIACAGAPSKTSDQFELIGTRGVATFVNGTTTLAGSRDETRTFDEPQSYLDSYAGAIAHFVQCLRDDTEFEITGAEHLRTLALVEQAYAAAAQSAANRKAPR